MPLNSTIWHILSGTSRGTPRENRGAAIADWQLRCEIYLFGLLTVAILDD
ncbi:hypothetical protein [Gloeocapsa sp. PCC 73106]|nr:hypothetical protein [Gloeocapsa sp. PCC 73106]